MNNKEKIEDLIDKFEKYDNSIRDLGCPSSINVHTGEVHLFLEGSYYIKDLKFFLKIMQEIEVLLNEQN